jgi:hypothetical protein
MPTAKKKPLSQQAAAKVAQQKFNVTDKALLCIVDFKKAGNRARVPNKHVKTAADKDWTRTSKALLDCPELLAINAFDGQVQNFLRDRALPSPFKGGIWLVPMDLIDPVDEKLTEFDSQRRALVEAFLEVYPAAREVAHEKLGPLFNEDDYPEGWKMRAQFAMRWRYVAFGVPNSLKSVKEAIFKREQDKAAAMWQEATADIQNLMRAKLAELVSHIVDRLTPSKDGKAKKFHNTLTDNLNDFLGTFDARNICDDASLKALVDQAKGLVNGVQAGQLRDDKELREKINAGFGAIKTELDKIVVAKPARKVKFAREDGADGATEAEAPAA